MSTKRFTHVGEVYRIGYVRPEARKLRETKAFWITEHDVRYRKSDADGDGVIRRRSGSTWHRSQLGLDTKTIRELTLDELRGPYAQAVKSATEWLDKRQAELNDAMKSLSEAEAALKSFDRKHKRGGRDGENHVDEARRSNVRR
jgi:hypothetical protein